MKRGYVKKVKIYTSEYTSKHKEKVSFKFTRCVHEICLYINFLRKERVERRYFAINKQSKHENDGGRWS